MPEYEIHNDSEVDSHYIVDGEALVARAGQKTRFHTRRERLTKLGEHKVTPYEEPKEQKSDKH